MKYVFLLVFLIYCDFAVVFCQPILTGANSNPTGIGETGEMFITNYCPNQPHQNQMPGDSGVNVLWDYSDLQVLYSDTFSYFSCMGAPVCTVFPGTNIYSPPNSNNSAYFLYIANSDSFSYLGLPDTAITYNNFSQHWDTTINIIPVTGDGTIMRYPFTLNSSYTINFKYEDPNPDTSSHYYHYGSESYHGDAYGTLILPSGTFHNVLRIHETFLNTDSQIVNSVLSIYHEHDELYYWYMPNFHNYLLNVGINFYSAPSTETDTSINYVTNGSNENTEVAGPGFGKPYLTVYPNPVRESLSLSFSFGGAQDDKGEGTARVYDAVGRLVYDKHIVKGTTIDMKDFVSGVYFLQVIYQDGSEDVRKITKD